MTNFSSQELIVIVPSGQDGPCLVTIARGREDYLAKAQVDSPLELQLVAASGGNWIAKRKFDEQLGERKLWGDWYDVDLTTVARALRESSGQVVQDLRNRQITGRDALGIQQGAKPLGYKEDGDPIYTDEQRAKIKELMELGVKITPEVALQEGIPLPRLAPGQLA